MSIALVCVNFLRPECTKKCIKSLLNVYPEIDIFLIDQDKEDNNKMYNFPNVKKIIRVPFDFGLSKSRNLAIDEILKYNYEYIMWGDNDFIFTADNGINKAINLIKNNKADIVGGAVEKNGKTLHYEKYLIWDKKRNNLIIMPLNYISPEPLVFDGIKYYDCDLTFNYAIAKRQVFENMVVRWFPDIKVKYEHLDIFLTFKEQGYRVAYCPEMKVIHEHVDPEEYKQFRYRKEDRANFQKHWNIHYSFALGEGRFNYMGGEFIPEPHLKNIKKIIKKPNKIKNMSLLEEINTKLNKNNIFLGLIKYTCRQFVEQKIITNPYYFYVKNLAKTKNILKDLNPKESFILHFNNKVKCIKISHKDTQITILEYRPIKEKQTIINKYLYKLPYPVIKYLYKEKNV